MLNLKRVSLVIGQIWNCDFRRRASFAVTKFGGGRADGVGEPRTGADLMGDPPAALDAQHLRAWPLTRSFAWSIQTVYLSHLGGGSLSRCCGSGRGKLSKLDSRLNEASK